jgi:hypothetical protein
VVDGPYILGISLHRHDVYGIDCNNDTQLTWNIKNMLEKDEAA